MSQETRICTELNPPDHGATIAAAIGERPSNALHGWMPSTTMALNALPAPYIAVFATKMWAPGRQLRIAFVGPVDSVVRTRIEDHARAWLHFVNLDFQFVAEGPAEIRIATAPGGSWSYIGTDALTIPADQPTMNFGWLAPDTPDEEYQRVVLHEFGHALGAIHEHQHPLGGIPWDRPKVYAYYARMGWSREDVDQNVFAKYAMDQLNLSAYDPASIMHYAVPNELTIGDWEIGWNTALSPTDRAFMGRIYP